MDIKDIVALLDNSQDAEAIALEIVSRETLNNAVSAFYTLTLNNYKSKVIATNYTACIIRELWDIAYTHGYYDGKTESENN